MQNLHANFAIVLMDCVGNLSMVGDIIIRDQILGVGMRAALCVGANTAGHYKSNTTFGALGKIGRHTLMTIGRLFQSSVHGAHQNAVLKLGKTQIQRG